MTEILESVKKAAEKAAKAAQQAMSDKVPKAVELGGSVEKQPKPGAVISAQPVIAPPGNGPASALSGGGK